MANRALLALVTALAFALPRISCAQAPPEDCASSRTAVFFGNGVLTTSTEAYLNLKRTEFVYLQAVPPEEGESVSFHLAYNRTEGVVDFVESIRQILGLPAEDSSSIFDWLRGRTAIALTPQTALAVSGEITRFVGNSAVPDLDQQVAAYQRQFLLMKARVILVAHSQGNFFANQAYLRLSDTQKDHFGILAVASPDSTVAGVSRHLTVFEDLVIAGGLYTGPGGPLTLPGVPNSLPPNSANGNRRGDSLGHNYLAIYAQRGNQSREDLEVGLRVLAALVPFPEAECAPPPGSCQPVPPGDTCNVYRVDRFRANNATATRTWVWWDSNNAGGRPPDTVDPPRAVAVNEPITPVHICKAGTVWLPKQRTVSASTSRTNPPDTSCQVNTGGAAHAMSGPGLSVSCESGSSVTVGITEAGRLNVTRSFASRDEVPYAAEYAPYPCGGSNDTVKDGTVTWDLATGAGSIQDNLDIDIRIQLTWGYDYGCANITREAIAHDETRGNWDIAGDALPPAGVTFVRTIAAGQPLPPECTSAAD